MELDQVQKVLAERWKKLLEKYIVDKKKDPCFTVPPSEDMLPRAEPTQLWQQGKEKWQVDASVHLAGDNVRVSSAFPDKEMVGDRSIMCLSAGKGDLIWRKPLKLNPWGGASVSGD